MAYTKTTWNNLSDPPINAENLNKIEQGIYDNSLGIDKINPSGTATTTVEIEEGQISDVIGFKSLKLKGQTSQYTTTGQNILPQDKYIATQTINGITYTNNGDGTFNLSGTANANTTIEIVPNGSLQLEANQSYYLYSSVPYNGTTFNMSIPMTDNGTTKFLLANNTYTPTTTPTNERLQFYITSGQSINQTNIKAMLVKGSTAPTTYEPYTNGASPNPDFPQDVNNVSGDNVIGISNKNVLPNPIQSQTLNGVTVTRYSDGTLLINGTATANTYFDFSTDFDTTKYAGYKFYGFPDNPGFFIRISKSNRVSIQDISTNGTVISNNGTGNYIAIRIASGANVNNRLLSPMIIAPTISDTSYVPHRENNFEINLGKNLLNNIVISQTKHGITFTVNGDKTVYANGTATSSNALALNQVYLEKGKTYFLSGCPSGGGSGKYTLSINTTGTTTRLATDEGSGVSYTPTESGTYDISIGYWYGFSLNNLLFKPQLEEGISTSYAPYFPPIEICKIGTYQDYIFKRDGKWWKHKAIGKIILNGSENWAKNSGDETTYEKYQLTVSDSITSANNSTINYIKSNYFNGNNANSVVYSTPDNDLAIIASNRILLCTKTSSILTLADFKAWLSSNNVNVYYVLATPIEEEITYTPLIRQLDELYNSGLYDVTNISQDNSSEAFILDIEACKNNINGIVEYIRR